MKRKSSVASIVVIVLLFSMIFTSCGGNQGGAAQTTTAAAAQTTKAAKTTKAAETTAAAAKAETTAAATTAAKATEKATEKATTAKPAATTEAAKAESGEKEVLKFSAAIPAPNTDMSNTPTYNAWVAKCEELLGAKLDMNLNMIPDSEYNDKIQILISTNDLPDMYTLPFLFDFNKMANDGYFLDFLKYYEMPVYMEIVDKSLEGRPKAIRDDGTMPVLYNVGMPKVETGKMPTFMLSPCWNYTAFQREGIKIPDTFDELYEAALKFKEVNPRSYPINFNFKGVKVIFYAMHINADLEGPSQLYWDGEQYTFAGLQPQYKEGVEFLAKLYAEELLDPEYIIDNTDTITTKLLNEDNYMILNNWSSHTLDYTTASNGDYIFVNGIMPCNPKYGPAWHQHNADNAYSLTFWAYYVVNSEVKQPELMARFMDIQYSPEIYELFSWGVEGVTYESQPGGGKKFVDALLNAEDPVVKANELGIRARNGRARSLFDFIADMTPWNTAFPVNDNTYFNGVFESAPMHLTKFFQESTWPNEITPAFWDARESQIQLTPEENDIISPIIVQMHTFGEQLQANLISGAIPLSDFDAKMEEWRSSFDYQLVLDTYNGAAERALGRRGN